MALRVRVWYEERGQMSLQLHKAAGTSLDNASIDVYSAHHLKLVKALVPLFVSNASVINAGQV